MVSILWHFQYTRNTIWKTSLRACVTHVKYFETKVKMRHVTFLCDCRLGLGLAFDLFAQRSILHFSLPSSTVICCENVRIWSRGLLCVMWSAFDRIMVLFCGEDPTESTHWPDWKYPLYMLIYICTHLVEKLSYGLDTLVVCEFEEVVSSLEVLVCSVECFLSGILFAHF